MYSRDVLWVPSSYFNFQKFAFLTSLIWSLQTHPDRAFTKTSFQIQSNKYTYKLVSLKTDQYRFEHKATQSSIEWNSILILTSTVFPHMRVSYHGYSLVIILQTMICASNRFGWEFHQSDSKHTSNHVLRLFLLAKYTFRTTCISCLALLLTVLIVCIRSFGHSYDLISSVSFQWVFNRLVLQHQRWCWKWKQWRKSLGSFTGAYTLRMKLTKEKQTHKYKFVICPQRIRKSFKCNFDSGFALLEDIFSSCNENFEICVSL